MGWLGGSHGGEPWDPKGQKEVVNQNAGGQGKWGSRRTAGKVTVPFIEREEPGRCCVWGDGTIPSSDLEKLGWGYLRGFLRGEMKQTAGCRTLELRLGTGRIYRALTGPWTRTFKPQRLVSGGRA